jgi:cyclic-di-AMP phosphodiesterase PgpH
MTKFSFDQEGNWWHKWKDHRLLRTILYIVFGVVLYGLLVGNIAPDYVDVSIGTIAEEDIVSPVNMIDQEATERLQEQAAREVAPIYIQDNTITNRQIDQLNQAFKDVLDIIEDEDMTEEEQSAALAEAIPYTLDADLDVLLQYDAEEIETMHAVTRDIVSRIMYEGVSEEGNGLHQARQQVDESLVISTLDSELRTLSREMARESILPNYVLDQEETEFQRQEARDNVRPVEIREGEVLVSAGEPVTRDSYRHLRDAGLLSDEMNWFPFLGLALFILLIVLFLGAYIGSTDLDIRHNNNQFLMFLIIFMVNVILMKVISIGQLLNVTGSAYLAPVACGTMLMTMLLHQRMAVFSSFLFGLIAAVMFNQEITGHFDVYYGISALFSAAAGAFFLGNTSRKRKILQAGFFISLVAVLTVITNFLLRSMPGGWIDISLALLFAFLSGILACILTIGITPFFEAAFGILSPVKLLELSSPNQPLLRKVLLEAPGTYHHSVMVANLSEAAAEAVGANGLLARVGAYYHDVGKTKRPHFFVENQMNIENPHDKISPQLSATIIMNHVKDGKQMLQEEGLPQPIQDIAEQHHGRTLIKYFYHQAKQESDCNVNENDFRYPGPKPQFKESAIVGIADAMEAAVRSLSKPSPERIEHLARSIIRDRLDDGEFNECDLTLKELDIVAKTICETLKGTFHSRIEYPEEVKKDKASKNSKNGKDKDKKQLPHKDERSKAEGNQKVEHIEDHRAASR